MSNDEDQEKDRAAIIRMIAQYVALSEATLTKFHADFLKDPVYALEWSGATFEAAALSKALYQVRVWLDTLTVAQTRRLVARELQLYALRGSRSTSAAANLMLDEFASAWARVHEMIL